jgi:hypothetical protein
VPFRLGEASLPDSVSRRHILVLGTSGSGKSVWLNHYLTTLEAWRASTAEVNKCVIYGRERRVLRTAPWSPKI